MSVTSVLRSTLLNMKHLIRFGSRSPQNLRAFHMSMLPYIVQEMMREMDRPTLYDQHFGMGLTPTHLADHAHLTAPLAAPLRTGYLRPWRHHNHAHTGVSNVVNDKNNFTVSLDVQQFKPEELTVKVVDNQVVVEGKHEERTDEHGFISRQFTRRYLLPEDCNMEALQSSLSSDGVLQLIAPKKAIEGARTIPITKTNAPAVKAAETPAGVPHVKAAPGNQQEEKSKQAQHNNFFKKDTK